MSPFSQQKETSFERTLKVLMNRILRFGKTLDVPGDTGHWSGGGEKAVGETRSE